jgi:hypothetical protein
MDPAVNFGIDDGCITCVGCNVCWLCGPTPFEMHHFAHLATAFHLW